VAALGAGFGMRLLAYEPHPDSAFAARHGVALLPLDQVAAEADYLSIHAPLRPQSRKTRKRKAIHLQA
jgi:lactate dehydrogenase-like 2-hydroxyacid dehydrogenase